MSPVFREVSLPPAVPGELYLHAMPGRGEPWRAFLEEAARRGVDAVISLASREEIREKSPEYAEAISGGALPFAWEVFPVPDFGIPSEREAYLTFLQRAAQRLRSGERILVHCGAGIGRTGGFAISLLLVLGVPLEDAATRVRRAGSYPETDAQRRFLEWVDSALRRSAES